MAEQCERACADVGRDPATLRWTWCGGCICASTREESEAIARDRFGGNDSDNFDFVGTPQQIVEQMRPFVDMGVDYFMLDCVDFPRRTTLELLINEVLPAVSA